MTWQVYLTPTARRLLHQIRTGDAAGYTKILQKVQGLRNSPEKQGRALLGPLKGLRRIVAASRYRVIYKVPQDAVVVHVLAVGARKKRDTRDIYEIAQKLLRAKLL
jgi:mRNA-degrading endonuclease RelE of RelBE toxin-antitoxin system